jgi:chemotaxis family two-component system sensor kinase Cph1
VAARDEQELNRALAAANARSAELVAELELRLEEIQSLNQRYLDEIEVRRQTEERLAEKTAALESSNEDLRGFAHAASHDLREPLRTIASYVELLRLEYEPRLDDTARQYLTAVTDGVERMRGLLEAILAYAQATRTTLHPVVFDSTRALDKAVADLEARMIESGCLLTRDPLPVVRGDEALLTELFQNLLSNATKFRADRPLRVHVSARSSDTEHEFLVADNGIGIEPGHRERIFVAFERLHPRTRFPGTGLGLSVCKRIVERHGGHIWVESEPGVGSTFHFTVPRT